MKSRIKTLLTTTSLLLALSCFVVGVYASSEYSNIIDQNIAKHKTKTKVKPIQKSKLASLEIPQIIEEDQILEDWMFDSEFYFLQKEYQVEKWMLNKEFWILDNQTILNDDSSKNIKSKNNCSTSSGIHSNFLEKEWLENNKAFIL